MSKSISILTVGGPVEKKDMKYIQALEGFVEIENPQDRVWTITFQFKSPLMVIHTVKILDRVDGDGITFDNWEEKLATAIYPTSEDIDGDKVMIIGDTSPYEVITSLGVIDFKITLEKQTFFITTMKRTDDIVNPIVPNGIVLFRNGHYHDRTPLKFLFTIDGIEVRRKGHDDGLTIYKGKFTQSLSGWSRVAEYLGVGNLQDYKFNLEYSNSENPTVIQARQLGEFSYIESRNGMIAFTRMENPIEKLFREIKRTIAFAHISDHLKETLDEYAKNLMLNHSLNILRHRTEENNPVGNAIGDLLRFRNYIDELHQLMHKFTSLGFDRFGPDQTRY